MDKLVLLVALLVAVWAWITSLRNIELEEEIKQLKQQREDATGRLADLVTRYTLD